MLEVSAHPKNNKKLSLDESHKLELLILSCLVIYNQIFHRNSVFLSLTEVFKEIQI